MSASGSRAATVRLVGGRPFLDLVNTVSWRGETGRHEEHLVTVGDAVTWCVRAGVVTPAEADVLGSASPRLVDRLHALRELIATELVDAAEPGYAALQAAVLDAVTHAELVEEDGRAGWRVSALDDDTPARRIAADLYAYLSDPRGRLGVCADEACRWAFVDTSKRGDRRWCSSADCGNRHRVRRHQQRLRRSAVGGSEE